MTLTMRFHTAEMDQAIARLGDRAPRAAARAVNRAAVSTRAVWARDVAADLGLKVGTVRDRMVIQEARPTPDRLTAHITVRGARIPLMAFRARPVRGGVSARLPGGAGRYPGAFIAEMRSGHVGVFRRKGTARLPIRELRGPSLPHVAGKKLPNAVAQGEASLAKNLAHELKFALTQSS